MAGRPPPPKPWERGGGGGATPAEGLPKPWERPAGAAPINAGSPGSAAAATTSALAALGSPQQQQQAAGGALAPAPRPWEQQVALAGTSGALSSYGAGGYGAGGASMYGRSYGASTQYGGGAYGGGYGAGGMYGSSMYGAGSSMYGGAGYGGYGGAGGMYGRPYGGSMYGSAGGYGGGGGMYHPQAVGPYGGPNDPLGPPQPPSAWQAMLQAISGVVHFFGRLSFLVDENAHAVQFFISALLQLLDRFGSLYGELARFVLRLLGFRPKDKQQAVIAAAGAPQQLPGGVQLPPSWPPAARPRGLPGMPGAPVMQQAPQQPGTAGGTVPQWDSIWTPGQNR